MLVEVEKDVRRRLERRWRRAGRSMLDFYLSQKISIISGEILHINSSKISWIYQARPGTGINMPGMVPGIAFLAY